MSGNQDQKKATPIVETMSVSLGILAEFADAISADQELPGVGARLRKTLIEDHDLSETALREALFGDSTL